MNGRGPSQQDIRRAVVQQRGVNFNNEIGNLITRAEGLKSRISLCSCLMGSGEPQQCIEELERGKKQALEMSQQFSKAIVAARALSASEAGIEVPS